MNNLTKDFFIEGIDNEFPGQMAKWRQWFTNYCEQNAFMRDMQIRVSAWNAVEMFHVLPLDFQVMLLAKFEVWFEDEREEHGEETDEEILNSAKEYARGVFSNLSKTPKYEDR